MGPARSERAERSIKITGKCRYALRERPRTRVHLRDCIARVTRKKRGDARSRQGKPSKCRGSCIQRAYRAKDTRGRSVSPSLPLSSLRCVTIVGHRSAIASTLGCSRKREPPAAANVTQIFLEKYGPIDQTRLIDGWNFRIDRNYMYIHMSLEKHAARVPSVVAVLDLLQKSSELCNSKVWKEPRIGNLASECKHNSFYFARLLHSKLFRVSEMRAQWVYAVKKISATPPPVERIAAVLVQRGR